MTFAINGQVPDLKNKEITFQTNESKTFLFSLTYMQEFNLHALLFTLRMYSEIIVLLL